MSHAPPPVLAEIVNRKGLHARAAAAFVKKAATFKCAIHVTRNGTRESGHSIMGLMMLAASKGTSIEISASGSDATEALDTLGDLVANGFGEGAD